MRTASAFDATGAFRCELAGYIASAAFTSGHRFVVGIWHESPLGPMADVMWSRPGGQRVLLVDRPAVGELITAVYRFDAVEQMPLVARVEGDSVKVSAGDLVLELRGGREWPIPLARLRGRPMGRRAEAPVARWLLGVRTFGTSPTGVDEWYRSDRYRRVVDGRATLAGQDLGSICRFRGPTGFGFSEPPRRPAVVRVRPLLVDTGGALEGVLTACRERDRAGSLPDDGPGRS
ncbi:MAG TPA: hypothetical protein VHS52_09920 [Acidimicrobiales bacterium]|nr:hypothetical protein [Acidimicrobiales bacterium]